MTKAEAFLSQARSDLRVFESLSAGADTEPCHALHYLQMAMEKLSKAVFYTQNHTENIGHETFSHVRLILMNRKFAARLGFKNQFNAYAQFIKTISPLMHEIEALCPGLADRNTFKYTMPNVEYPWLRPNNEWVAPCDYNFRIYSDMRKKSSAKQLLSFLRLLTERFDEIF